MNAEMAKGINVASLSATGASKCGNFPKISLIEELNMSDISVFSSRSAQFL
jgi:hypothetical protein